MTALNKRCRHGWRKYTKHVDISAMKSCITHREAKIWKQEAKANLASMQLLAALIRIMRFTFCLQQCTQHYANKENPANLCVGNEFL